VSTLAPTRVSAPLLTVDLAAVAENTRLFARRSRALMAVVKADAYGHGAAEVARAALAAGARMLGVTSLAEAAGLRNAGLAAPILSWLNPVAADWPLALRHRVEVAVPSVEHLAAIVRDAPGLRVHLQLDTGMARDGAAPPHWRALCGEARREEGRGRVRVAGIMGHLALAERPEDDRNRLGRERFAHGVATARAEGLRPGLVHLAATAATLTDPAARHDLSRVGAGLVGIDPSRSIALRPALTLTAPLVDVREVPAGTGVGYGHDWITAAPTRLGLLPVGYADGLPRAASGRAEVSIAGTRRPLAGRISMDMAVVDLGELPSRRGDPVVIFGPGDAGEPTVREWAEWADTIEHEIVVGLGSRLERRHLPAVTA
jgi:alanine racemase